MQTSAKEGGKPMNTGRLLVSNRRNAGKSGGPRSAAGKSRASRNALRHGLAAITHRSPVPEGDVERLARAICGDDDDQQLFDAAVAIAENHLVRRAIEAQQVAVIERLRDRTAIALAKGDNSFDLGKARFLAVWLMDRDIEARVAQLLEKYQIEPSPPGQWDESVPFALKALLLDCESDDDFQHAWAIAEKCLKQEERGDDEALEEAVPDLKRLDRYERRAWSQYKRAVREFMNIKLVRTMEQSENRSPQ
jgi:hypothetical protein